MPGLLKRALEIDWPPFLSLSSRILPFNILLIGDPIQCRRWSFRPERPTLRGWWSSAVASPVRSSPSLSSSAPMFSSLIRTPLSLSLLNYLDMCGLMPCKVTSVTPKFLGDGRSYCIPKKLRLGARKGGYLKCLGLLKLEADLMMRFEAYNFIN